MKKLSCSKCREEVIMKDFEGGNQWYATETNVFGDILCSSCLIQHYFMDVGEILRSTLNKLDNALLGHTSYDISKTLEN